MQESDSLAWLVSGFQLGPLSLATLPSSTVCINSRQALHAAWTVVTGSAITFNSWWSPSPPSSAVPRRPVPSQHLSPSVQILFYRERYIAHTYTSDINSFPAVHPCLAFVHPSQHVWLPAPATAQAHHLILLLRLLRPFQQPPTQLRQSELWCRSQPLRPDARRPQPGCWRRSRSSSWSRWTVRAILRQPAGDGEPLRRRWYGSRDLGQ